MMATGSAVVSTPDDVSIKIVREFDAPKHLVYRCFTEPELVKRWWSGQRGTVTSADIDLRVGGAWRWVMLAHGDFEVAFHGTYSEIVPDERLVYTEAFEGIPDPDGNAATVTVDLTEADGRTTATMHIVHKDQTGRDMHLNSGMEGGMQEAMDALEQTAISLA